MTPETARFQGFFIALSSLAVGLEANEEWVHSLLGTKVYGVWKYLMVINPSSKWWGNGWGMELFRH
jgi:hypothetical protein